jgi:LacI family transcriptional regulator
MHPFFGPVFSGIKARIVAARCDMFVPTYNPQSPLGPDARAIERCYAYGAEGLIIMGVDATDPDFAPLLESGRPIVLIDCQVIGRRVGYVISDNIEGAAAAVRHLYNLGRRRIATITGTMQTRPAVDRLFGYRSELSRLELEERPEYVVEGDYYHGSGYEKTKQLLALPEPPDAIVAASDMAAVGASDVALTDHRSSGRARSGHGGRRQRAGDARQPRRSSPGGHLSDRAGYPGVVWHRAVAAELDRLTIA